MLIQQNLLTRLFQTTLDKHDYTAGIKIIKFKLGVLNHCLISLLAGELATVFTIQSLDIAWHCRVWEQRVE